MATLFSSVARQFFPFIVLCVCGVALSLPCLLWGFPEQSQDELIQGQWNYHFAAQLWRGEWYPRWLSDLNAGLGSPTFFFYPPLSHYTAALFYPLTEVRVWDALALSCAVSTVASGCTAYLWLRGMVVPRAALLGAILYLVLPYHVTSDVYERCAFAEFWSFVWMPLVLHYVHELGKGTPRAMAGLAVSFALLLCTHLLTTMMFAPLVVGYGLFVHLVLAQRKSLWPTITGLTLGAALAAFYVVPAMMLLKYVTPSVFTGPYYTYYNHFLLERSPLSVSDNYNTIKRSFVMLSMFVPALVAWGVLMRAGKQRMVTSEGAGEVRGAGEVQGAANRKLGYFFGGSLLVVFFMMTSYSKTIWEFVSPLQMVQFPWRFNTVLCVIASALLGLSVQVVFYGPREALGQRRHPMALWRSVLIGTFVTFLIFWVWYFMWQVSYSYAPDKGVLPPAPNVFAADVSEYTTRWVVRENTGKMTRIQTLVAQQKRALGTPADKSTPWRLGSLPILVQSSDADARVKTEKLNSRLIQLQVQTTKPTDLTISHFYFPGWKAQSSTNASSFSVKPSKPDGFIFITIPAATTDIITLRLEATTPEKIGYLVSMGAVLVLLFLTFTKPRRQS